MNTNEILYVLESDAATKSICGGVFASDKLPSVVSVPCAIVVNLDPSTKPGSHWVAIHIDANRNADYFDPLGMRPPVGPIHDFLVGNSHRLLISAQKVQGNLSAACGPHCLFYLLLRSRGLKYPKIMFLYSLKDRIANDFMVVHLINKRFRLTAKVFDVSFFRRAYKDSAPFGK